jgi:hypothetical protein
MAVIAGPSEKRSPEFMTAIRRYGFRTCRFAAIWNGQLQNPEKRISSHVA